MQESQEAIKIPERERESPKKLFKTFPTTEERDFFTWKRLTMLNKTVQIHPNQGTSTGNLREMGERDLASFQGDNSKFVQ